jgi:ubiE/COQ5 methyltransferase-like protein
MNTELLSILRSPLLPDEPVRFEGEGDDGLLCAGVHVVGFVEKGIPSFVAPIAGWGPDGIERLRTEEWITRNWENRRSKSTHEPSQRLIQKLADTGGIMVDIATGPGAGFVPEVLMINPDHRVIMNEISIGILHLQREYLANSEFQNIEMVAADATKPYLAPGSVDAMASGGGISNTPDCPAGYRVAFESLRPGGLLAVCEFVHSADEIAQLPKEMIDRCSPVTTWTDVIEGVGFEIESVDIEHETEPQNPEDSGWSGEAAKHGVVVYKHLEQVIAQKPT